VIDQPPAPPAPEAPKPAPPWYRHPLTLLAAGLVLGGLIGVIIIITATGDDTPATTAAVTTTIENITTTAPPPGAEQWIGVEFAGDLPAGLHERVAMCLGDPLCAYALRIVGTEETIPAPDPNTPLEIMVWLTKNAGSQGGDTLWRVVDAEEYTFSEPGIALSVMDCYEGDLGGQPAFGIMEHPVYMEIYGIIAADLTTETLHLGSGTGYECSGGG